LYKTRIGHFCPMVEPGSPVVTRLLTGLQSPHGKISFWVAKHTQCSLFLAVTNAEDAKYRNDSRHDRHGDVFRAIFSVLWISTYASTVLMMIYLSIRTEVGYARLFCLLVGGIILFGQSRRHVCTDKVSKDVNGDGWYVLRLPSTYSRGSWE
jgi:hypothetical protein